MKQLRALEAALVRAEAAVAVTLVLVMLALAGYGVVYRNVLVPLQKHWAHSGPPTVPVATPTPVAVDRKAAPEQPPAGEPEGADGFAGDWGEGGDDDDEAKAAPPEPDGAADGFAGDWGEGDDGADEPAADAKAGPGPAAADDDEEFTKLARIDTTRAQADGEDLGGPPPEGSFAARMVAVIDAVKLPWIDVVLRQLVILVAFFGAMMATQRGKHINVDALSKLLKPGAQRWLGVATNALATGVCLVFARAGASLVAISREHPHELVPWADEWVFQLMFPFGFGLLAFHFGVQTLAAALAEPAAVSPGGAA